MTIHCDGCHGKFKREGDWIQHVERTRSPLCQAAGKALKAKLQPVKGSRPIRNIPVRRVPTTQQPVDDDVPMPFTGDYFGENYTNADFPFPGEEDNLPDLHAPLPQVDEEEDTDNSDTESEEDGLGDAGININEQPRAPSVSLPTLPVVLDNAPPPNLSNAENEAGPTGPTSAPGGIGVSAHDSLRVAPHHITEYPGEKAGAPIRTAFSGAAATGYHQYGDQLRGSNAGNIWAPFASKMDWEVAQWAKSRGPGSTAFTELLGINGVSSYIFCNSGQV